MNSTHLVVMAGGSGTRFWPKSTAQQPKQLLKFGGAKSLLAQTLDRFEGLIGPDARWIVTTEGLVPSIRAEVGGTVHLLGEPQARNTAPCLFWAAQEISKHDPDAVMVVMPADHAIFDLDAFRATVGKAIEWARSHADLVTLGIEPTRPETGYGYLKRSESVGPGVLRVEKFVEKPSHDVARTYLESGQYLWNGGMFVWKVSTLIAAFRKLMPEFETAWKSSAGEIRAAYPKMTATSIDFGVMEKASNVVTLPLDCGWDDVGSWTTLEGMAETWPGRISKKFSGGVLGSGTVSSVDSSGNIVDAEGLQVALLGVHDLIVVAANGTVMVADKSRAQDVKKLIEAKREN